MAEEAIEEDYRQGVVDALRWMLFDTEIGTRFSWKTLRNLERSGAKVIPIRPGIQEAGNGEPASDDEHVDGPAEQARDGSEP
jgi:hypothetical protein